MYTWRHWLSIARFVAIHLVCLAAIWTGVTARALTICAVLYCVQMFAVTAFYHRHFAHRSFKMGRAARFVAAFLAQSTGQRSVIWWAATHRHHHRHSDGPEDLHSPRHGFLWAHVGWVLHPSNDVVRFERIPDLARDLERCPELRLLHRFQYTPVIIVGVLCLLIGGWSGLVAGFFWGLIAVFHATFTINSLAHIWGRQRYDTGDDSRNNPLLALLTFGEGWHNNHHHFQASARQGFFWWELDLTWCGLWVLEKLGVIWDVRRPTARVLERGAAAK